MSVECSNCGAEIPYAGRVCPFCGNEKAQDKRNAWVAFGCGLVGIYIGFSIFDNGLISLFCFFPGYFLDYVFGGFIGLAGGKKKQSSTMVDSKPLPQQDSPIANKLAQLKQLHEQGLLTDDEYASKKAEI